MKDILENDESPLDECPICGALGEWFLCFAEWDAPGNNAHCDASAFKCGMCGEEWTE